MLCCSGLPVRDSLAARKEPSSTRRENQVLAASTPSPHAASDSCFVKEMENAASAEDGGDASEGTPSFSVQRTLKRNSRLLPRSAPSPSLFAVGFLLFVLSFSFKLYCSPKGQRLFSHRGLSESGYFKRVAEVLGRHSEVASALRVRLAEQKKELSAGVFGEEGDALSLLRNADFVEQRLKDLSREASELRQSLQTRSLEREALKNSDLKARTGILEERRATLRLLQTQQRGGEWQETKTASPGPSPDRLTAVLNKVGKLTDSWREGQLRLTRRLLLAERSRAAKLNDAINDGPSDFRTLQRLIAALQSKKNNSVSQDLVRGSGLRCAIQQSLIGGSTRGSFMHLQRNASVLCKVQRPPCMRLFLQDSSEELASRDLLKEIEVVPLAISKRLNDKQRAFDELLASAVRRLPPLEELRSVEETEQEVAVLQSVKQKMMEVFGQASSKKVPRVFIEGCRGLLEINASGGVPGVFRVEDFRRVDQLEGEGAAAVFRAMKILHASPEVMVVEVAAVDETGREDSRRRFAMKVAFRRTEPGEEESEEEGDSQGLNEEDEEESDDDVLGEIIEKEAEAFRRLALEGEDVVATSRRTGAHLVQYTASLQHLEVPAASAGGDFRFFQKVAFSPKLVFTLDLLEAPTYLPIDVRVYIAQGLLRTAAHLQLRGLCHNDLKVENAGINQDLVPAIFDCEGLTPPGEERSTWSDFNVPPEVAVRCSRDEPVQASFGQDAWGLGVALFQVLAFGLPPFSTDEEFFWKLSAKDEREAASAAAMQNVESPVFNLRRFGVPREWQEIVAMLLQREPQHRPTPLQILRAYPRVAAGPLSAVDSVHESDSAPALGKSPLR